MAAILLIGCSAANATLIHTLHIKHKGPRGFKDVGEFTFGGILNRKWCIDPGILPCPYICDCGGDYVSPNAEAGLGGSGLQAYQLDFIALSLSEANLSTDAEGLITKVYLLDGVQRVITAKFTKSEDSFMFNVVENNAYEENLNELGSIE